MDNKKNTLQFCKVRVVKSPFRAHEFDAGIDFFVPEDLDAATMTEKCKIVGQTPEIEYVDGCVKTITLKPGESVLIPSGIKVRVPAGHMLQFTNKSGIATKRHLLIGANVVDCGYTGECHINVHNVGTCNAMISTGDKLVQGILIPVSCAQPEELLTADELYANSNSARGDGGFGSTGTK